jgi:hypothetical protein
MFPEPADSGDDFDILGKIQGLPLRERGWRIRLKGGHELNLVREPGDFWFVDGVV